MTWPDCNRLTVSIRSNIWKNISWEINYKLKIFLVLTVISVIIYHPKIIISVCKQIIYMFANLELLVVLANRLLHYLVSIIFLQAYLHPHFMGVFQEKQFLFHPFPYLIKKILIGQKILIGNTGPWIGIEKSHWGSFCWSKTSYKMRVQLLENIMQNFVNVFKHFSSFFFKNVARTV